MPRQQTTKRHPCWNISCASRQCWTLDSRPVPKSNWSRSAAKTITIREGVGREGVEGFSSQAPGHGMWPPCVWTSLPSLDHSRGTIQFTRGAFHFFGPVSGGLLVGPRLFLNRSICAPSKLFRWMFTVQRRRCLSSIASPVLV